MLKGKRILISGAAASGHIAAAVAAARCLELGARVVLAPAPRDHDHVRASAAELGHDVCVLPLDTTDPRQLTRAAYQLAEQLAGLDGVLHTANPAPCLPLDELTDADARDVELAFRTSTWTLAALARILRRLAPRTGASLVVLDVHADQPAGPAYDWAGAGDTALGATSRNLARDLAPHQIRVNLVATGPLRTGAASAVPDPGQLVAAWANAAPLHWNPYDAGPVADTVCFLLSDLARAVTGDTIHVDGGYHAVATPRPLSTHNRLLDGFEQPR